MTAFRYHANILERYPDLRAGVILARGMANGPTPPELAAAYHAEQQTVLERVGSTPLSELESLSAWRSAFRGFGVNPTKYRSAPEALLRRLTKKGDIPGVNALVDIGNLVSIRYALPVAVFDRRAPQGVVTVRFADGSERFTPLFERTVEHPESGEVVFSDETGLVIARRWCWRQSDDSATRDSTRDAIIAIEAQHPGGSAAVEAGLRDLLELLDAYVGGEFESAALGPGSPEI